MITNTRLFCFLLGFVLAFGASAQTTFNVNASCILSDIDDLFVTGPWCGWSANDTYNTMTDPDGDGVYSVTVEELDGTVEYKYAINGFAEQENLVNDMVDGANCAPVTDFSAYANRTTEAGSTTYDYYGSCDGTCNDYPPTAYGCTDDGACNFSINAIVDDGSCDYTSCYINNGLCCDPSSANFINPQFCVSSGEFPEATTDALVSDIDCGDLNAVFGCTIELACNYNLEANIDDNSCFFDCLGCTDNTACNFDPAAEQEDGSCQYLDECGVCGGIGIAQGECDCDGTIIDALGVCGGSCAADADNDGICDDIDDDVWQCEADFSFGEVEFGLSPNPALGEPFENGVLGEPYADVLHILVPATAAGIDETYPPTLPVDSIIVADDVVNGVNDYSGFVFVDTATDSSFFANEIGLSLAYNNNGDSPNASTFLGANQYCAVIQGVPTRSGHYRIDIDIIAWATIFTPFNVPFAFEDFSLTILDSSFGCTNSNACNYNQEVTEDAGNCIYADALGVCGGDCLEDDDSNGVCDNSEVLGCAYELADNYDVNVTRDDGSCIFPCEGVVNTNVFDWDGDYVVTVTDFLMMLSVYGDTDVDLDGVWDSGDDCVDTNACNYANDPSEPCAYIDVLGVCGGGCEGDQDADGICDDIDTCIGVEDQCGVCNGPGPTEVVIEDITILFDSVYAEQIDQWFVFEVGQDTTFSYTCAPFFGGCGDPVGYQGYDYATVLIGDQCWFAENLRSENYENGDAIPLNLSDSEWSSTTSGAVAVYGEDAGCDNLSPDIDACDPAQSLEEYGRLYNWYAVDDARGLCPSGWHVPTDGEWTVMTDELGGQSIAGGQMKTTYGWYQGGNGTNSSDFSGLPGGLRDFDGVFANAGDLGGWWSSSPFGSNAWSRLLGNYEDVFRLSFNLRYGFSVRCVRDAE